MENEFHPPLLVQKLTMRGINVYLGDWWWDESTGMRKKFIPHGTITNGSESFLSFISPRSFAPFGESRLCSPGATAECLNSCAHGDDDDVVWGRLVDAAEYVMKVNMSGPEGGRHSVAQ